MITFRVPDMTIEYVDGVGLEVWHVGFLRKYRPGWWYRLRPPWSALVPETDHGCHGSNSKAYGWTKRQAIARALRLHAVDCHQ